jgi:hypothetical protein
VTAPDPPPGEPLSFRLLIRRTLSTYRTDFPLVAGLAVAIFVPLAVAETFIKHGLDDYWEAGGGAGRLAVLVIGLAVTTASLFGVTLYAGVLDHVVGERHYGHEHREMSEILEGLPVVRLMVANFSVALIVVLGYLVLVVPGLILMTLLAIVGPLVNIERHTVREAMRHSVRLVRPRFWLAFFGVTVPLTFEHALGHALNEMAWADSIAAGLITNALLALLVGALVGIVEVTLAHELISRDRASHEPAAGAQGPSVRAAEA